MCAFLSSAKMNPRLLLLLLLSLALLSGGVSLASGSLNYTAHEIAAALFGQGDATTIEVIRQLRLPRVAAAFACGGLLSLAGVLLQALLRNPLADPYILGISGGAAVGALVAVLLGMGAAVLHLASFGGALLTITMVFGLGFRRGERNIYRLLLTGVVLSAGCGAVVSLLLALAPSEQIKGMLFWLIGDLSNPEGVPLAWFVLITLGICSTIFSAGLDVLAGGSSKAAALGVQVSHWQAAIYFAAAMLTMAALQVGGSIGFVGLMIPHAIRLLGVCAHRWLGVLSILLGGSFLVLADTMSRTLWSPLQLPVGIFTALLGVPFLLWLLGTRR